jgi:hypothetical protein
MLERAEANMALMESGLTGSMSIAAMMGVVSDDFQRQSVNYL